MPTPTTDDVTAASERPVPPKAKRAAKAAAKAAGARQPSDHRERRAEATGALLSNLTVEYGEDGEGKPRVYVIDRAAAEDVEIFEKIEDGNYVTAVRAFIGPGQWQVFKDAHRDGSGRVPMTALEGLLQAIVNERRSAQEGAGGNS